MLAKTLLGKILKKKILTDDQGPGDPEFKGTVERLSRENKHIILETEDNALVECTIQWLKMYEKILKRESWKELPRKKRRRRRRRLHGC